MTTALKLGPADHGRRLTLEEFYASECQLGATYELIKGRLFVSPFPELPYDCIRTDLLDSLFQYGGGRRSRTADAQGKAWVYGPNDEGPTILRPDVAVYRDLPAWGTKRRKLNWEDFSPLIVADVLDPGYEEKDLVRNPELYLTILSMREYWVVDTRPGVARPDLVVHRRRGSSWRIINVPHRGTYTTRLLPGFELVLDPFPEEE